jgi:hypothetical protein
MAYSSLVGVLCKGARVFLPSVSHREEVQHSSSVADPDPGSGIGAFLTPGSGIRDPE